MNCKEFWELYPELDPGEPMPEHALDCSACAALLRRHRELAAGLTAAAADGRQIEPPRRIEAGLIAAFRAQQRSARAPRPMWVPLVTWGAAAAALLAIALLLVRGKPPEPARHRQPNAIELAVAPAAAAAAAAGDFIPLPNAEQVAANDDINLVRVEVPRAALLAAGLPVSGEGPADRVRAEVMLGPDGLARAVRLLNE